MQNFNENLKSNDPEIIYNSILNVNNKFKFYFLFQKL